MGRRIRRPIRPLRNFQWLTDNVTTMDDFLLFGLGALVVPTITLLALFWVKRRDWF